MTATTTTETIGWERFRTAVQAEMLARVPSTSSGSGGAPAGSRPHNKTASAGCLRTPPSTRSSTVDVWPVSTSIESILPICRACR
jgi:hypothetical protein